MGSDDPLRTEDARVPNKERVRLISAVVAIAAGAFTAEITAGYLAGSQALLADALDFGALSTALLLGHWSGRGSPALRAGLELGRDVLWTLAGAWIAISTLHQFLTHPVPQAEFVGAVGLLGLVANAAIMTLLEPAATTDRSLKAVRLASRNDMIGNVSVILAAGLVALMGTAAADLVVAGVLVAVFLTTSVPALRRSWRAFEATRVAAAVQQEKRP